MLDPNLVQYLLTNRGDARYLVATTTSTYASIFMLMIDQPALALGSYQGRDRILTPHELAATDGVRYFSLGIASAIRTGTADLVAWVRATCATVSTERWRATNGASSTIMQLPGRQRYDCAGAIAGQPQVSGQLLHQFFILSGAFSHLPRLP